jgi:uncharacterized protein YndB with AHSA1/START domain
MADIKHLFHIAAPREKVYEAISTVNGLSNWWTTQTSGESKPNGILEFRFGAQWFNKMKVLTLRENEFVEWECIEGASDWLGTKICFSLDEDAGKTRVRFEHAGWKEAGDFFGQCSFAWGRYMESLRQLCQTGTGEAFGSPTYRQ